MDFSNTQYGCAYILPVGTIYLLCDSLYRQKGHTVMGINYNRIAHVANLSKSIDKDGIEWTNELNIISWNGGHPVYDLREWDESHNKCRVGVKLSLEEMTQLVKGFSDFVKEVELI